MEEVIQTCFYSIMVDEVTSHNHELMPLCVRFVDRHKHIREELLTFSTLAKAAYIYIYIYMQ